MTNERIIMASDQSDSDYEFERQQEREELEEQLANAPYFDPDDYHDEL